MADQGGSLKERSRKYWRLKYGSSIAETAYLLVILWVFIASGLFRSVAAGVRTVAPDFWVGLALFMLILSAGRYLLAFPLHFFRSFILEHEFALTRQSVADWFKDQAKAVSLSYCLSVFLAALFYSLVKWQPRDWWWLAGLVWILVSLVLARLAPVAIIPLFFKYRPVLDEALRCRITALARKMGVAVTDVFEINLSRTTAKANAALVGWGKTRRVILGDTLRDAYTTEEIEAVLAHEFAHQKLGHMIRMLVSGACVILAGLYVFWRLWGVIFDLAGVSGLTDLAGLALIAAYFFVLGIVAQPFENLYSRRMEAAADRLALSATQNPQAFISLMEKLAAQNLADRAPGPLARLLFFDHPSVEERIAMARRAL